MEFKTQEEYLLALAEALKYMNPKDATKVLRYYETRITNAIEYGEKEEDVIRNLPDIETVAKETYESHGVNYLAMRKKLLKRKQIFNNIIGIILSLFIVVGFSVIIYFLGKSTANMFGLIGKTFQNGTGADKFVTPAAILLYVLCVLLLLIYVIDLFLILLSSFLSPIIKLKDEAKHRKIFTFTITGFIEEKSKNQKVQVKLLVSFIVLLLICVGVSYATGGYFKNSLNDVPSNSEIIKVDEVVDSINVTGYNGNIYFKKSETNEFIIEHQYEFKHDLNLLIKDNKLSVNLEMTKAYDILNLLNEPTQNIIFYIPEQINNLSINIDMDESIVDIADITLFNAYVLIESKGTLSVVNSEITMLQAKGYEMNFAVANSNILAQLELSILKGQTLIQQNSMVQTALIENGSSYLKFEDSEIKTLSIKNTSGTIDLKNLVGIAMVVTSSRSVNTLNNCKYAELDWTVSTSCQLTFSKTYAETIKVNATSSHVLLDYVKGNINLAATSGTLYISGVGENLESASSEYNSFDKETNLVINNSGSSCKTDIIDCNVNKISITQDGGFIKLKQSYLIDGSINATNNETIDLIDLRGDTCNLYISNVKETLIIDAKAKTGLKHVIKVIDTLSYARMLADSEVVDVINEAVTPNE